MGTRTEWRIKSTVGNFAWDPGKPYDEKAVRLADRTWPYWAPFRVECRTVTTVASEWAPVTPELEVA